MNGPLFYGTGPKLIAEQIFSVHSFLQSCPEILLQAFIQLYKQRV
jgi:hypothetical protein